MKKWIIFGIVVTGIGLWLGLRSAPADLTSAQIYFFHGTRYDDNTRFPIAEAKNIIAHNKFDKTKPTVLYFHGYIEFMEIESIHTIVDAYLRRGDHNLLVLDWAKLAEGNYLLDAVPNMLQLADALSTHIMEMIGEGMDLKTFHIVGHSLGGQMGGVVGRTIYKKSQKYLKLKRISALDPAFPPFYPGIVKALSKDDADFVDVIHTDAWLYGAPVSTGTVDFWPNGGKTLQPGCPKRNYKLLTDNALIPTDLCSHRRSWWFWAESVYEKKFPSFHSVKCKNWADFKNGKTIETTVPAYMGLGADPSLSGDFYLQTNGITPYSKGEAGMKYVEEIETPASK